MLSEPIVGKQLAQYQCNSGIQLKLCAAEGHVLTMRKVSSKNSAAIYLLLYFINYNQVWTTSSQ